jgi:hypothetical protein
MIKGIVEFMSGTLGIFLWGLVAIGSLYWLWIAIQIGSFLMFVIGVFPITTILIAMPVGAWSLLFGVPDWVISVFG